jgi:competence CoiA-like predicted nuclease
MRLALHNGELSTAEPRLAGHCPQCDSEVIAKCGKVTAWHWAHKADDCDSWSEPLTQWHADWQARFPIQWCEVPVGNHRADVLRPGGRVIEFQHSGLSVDEIRERERHYGPRMVWVFDAIDAYRRERLTLRRKSGDKGRVYYSFRWRHPRRSVMACTRRVYLDLGDGLLLDMRKMHAGPPYRGWGYPCGAEEFLSWHGVRQSA